MAVLLPMFGMPGSWKRTAAGAGIAAAIAVGVTGVWPVTAPAAAADEPESVSCSVERTAADGVSAMLTAKLSGCRIEDLSQRTETSSTFARPDGDWDITFAMSPVWVRTGGDGTAVEDWAALDTDLRADDEGFAPAAHPADVWISGAQTAGQDGVSVVASLTDPSTDATSEVTWPGDLPEPEVTGPRVRYLSVEPGVDMVVDMTGGGIEQYFVLHDVPADASQIELPVGVQSQEATVVDTSDDTEAAGLVDLVTADGEQDEAVVARVGVPLVWDAAYDAQLAHPVLADYDPADEAPLWAGALSDLEEADAEPEPEGPGLLDQVGAAVADAVNGEPEPLDLGEVAEASAQVDVAQGGESADITLGLSAAFAGAAETGPIVVDPSVSLALPWDTYVQSDSSVDKSTETELRLGTFDGGTTKARTFMNVTTSQIIGKSIRSATLKLWEHHSYSCTPAEWQVWNAGRVLGPITWDSHPTMGSRQASSTETKGHSASCDDGWVTMDMTALAKAWASDTATERGMALRAASETDSSGWKRFNSTNAATGKPTITVTVNTAPATPSSASLASGSYNWYYPSSTTTDRELYVKTTQPVFSTVVSDPEGDRVRSSVGLVEGATTVLANGVGSYVASGGRSTYTTAAGLLTHGHTYSANVRAYDGMASSAQKNLWTFKVDTAKPATPSVTASGYTAGQWKETKPSSNTFTFTDTSTDVVRFEYSLDGGAWTSVAATGTSSKTATLSWNPANGAHTIKVRAIDKAAWASTEKTFTFGAGGAAISTPTSAGLKSTSTVPVKATAPAPASGTVSAQVLWRVGGGAEPADFSATNGSRTGWTALEGTVPVTASASSVTTNSTLDVATIAGALGRARKATMLNVQVCFTYESPAATRCSWTADAKSKATATYVPHAFGDSFPTAQAGPGQVALWTGEFAMDATDVEFGDFTVGRSYATFDQPAGEAGLFGPAWTSTFDDASGGSAAMQVTDDTTFDGTITLTAGYGSVFVYTQPGTSRAERKPGLYEPVGSEQWGDQLEVSQPDAQGRGTVLALTESDGTVTTWNWTGGTWRATSVVGVDDPGEFRFDYDGQGRMTRMVAPIPETETDPISCDAGSEERGCRVLTVAYGTANSGTDATPGDRTGQVKQVSYIAWDPASSAMKTTEIARYAYNGAGLLVKVTDPRSNLSTAYSYSGTSSADVPLLTGVTPSGLAGWTFQHEDGTVGSKLLTVARDSASSGTPSVRLNRFVYGIEPSVSVNGLPGMTTADVAVWGQENAPAYGAAVFEQDKAGAVTGSAAGNVTADQWQFADIQYTDAQGRVINTASHGAGRWQLTATGYDEAGRVVRTLDAGATDQIRRQTEDGTQTDPDTYATLTFYNQDIVSTAPATGPGDEENPEASTIPAGTVIIPAGTVVTDTWYPAAEVTDPGTGETQVARAHLRTSFDQGSPNSGVDPLTGRGFALPTASTITQLDLGGEGATEAAVSETRYGYAPIDGADPLGDTSGWVHGEPTTTTKEMGAGQTDISTKIRFDRYGREVENRQPRSTGTDAGTTSIGYYSADPQTGRYSDCGGKPEWDRLVCRTGTAEQAPTQPVTTISYNYYQEFARSTETRGTVQRVMATTYLADGREETTSVDVTGLVGSEPVARTKTVYDAASGLPTATVELNDAGVETGRIDTTYDRWGRTTRYTDGDGQTTTTTYDAAGNVATVADAIGTTTYTYDSSTEHRGVLTGVNVDGSGQINATYDAAGHPIRQEMVGQVTQTYTYDRAGNRTGTTHETTDANGTPITLGAWTIGRDIAGRVVTENTNLGTGLDGAQGRSLTFEYDNAARLAEATDTLGGCTSVRAYEFDLNGNRTRQSNAFPTVNATTGTCGATTTTVTKSWTHDAADRVQSGATIDGQTSGSYTYDQLGRQTLIPAADTPTGSGAGNLTIGYYDTDAVRTLTQNGATTEYTLDPAGRRAVETTTSPDSSRTITRHYADNSDSPTWVETTADGQTASTWYGGSPTGDLAVSITDGQRTLMLSDPRGNLALTLPAAPGEREVTAAGTFDEYGNTVVTPAAPSQGPLEYGWLGAAKRATTDSGLVLMGARVYNPATGAFTSVDPVVGGNTTAYTYPQDPINFHDTTGTLAQAALYVLAMLIVLWLALFLFQLLQTFCQYGCGVRTTNRTVPFPSASRPSVKKFSKTKYIVYEIYRDEGGYATYKYGISRVGVSRPKGQISGCQKYYKGKDCDYVSLLRVTGWFYARMGEAGLIYAYARRHGHCPPGQFWSCI